MVYLGRPHVTDADSIVSKENKGGVSMEINFSDQKETNKRKRVQFGGKPEESVPQSQDSTAAPKT